MDELAFDVVFEPIDISECQPGTEATSSSIPHSPPADGKGHRPHRQVNAPANSLAESVASVSPRSVRLHAPPQQPHQPSQSLPDTLSASVRANVAFGKSVRATPRPAPQDNEKTKPVPHGPTAEEVQHEIAEDELRIAKMREQYPVQSEQQQQQPCQHLQVPSRTEVAPCSYLGSEDVSSSFYLVKVAQDIKVQPHDLMKSSRNILEEKIVSGCPGGCSDDASDSSPLIQQQLSALGAHSRSTIGMAPVPSFSSQAREGTLSPPQHSNISPHASIVYNAAAPHGSFVGNSCSPSNANSATRQGGKKCTTEGRGKRRGTQQGGLVVCATTPPDDRDSLDDDDDFDFFHDDAQEEPFLKAKAAPMDLAAWSFLDGVAANSLSVLSGGNDGDPVSPRRESSDSNTADDSKGSSDGGTSEHARAPIPSPSVSVSSIPVREVLLLRHGDGSNPHEGVKSALRSPSSAVARPHPPAISPHNVVHVAPQSSARHNNALRSPQSSNGPKSPDARPLPHFSAHVSMNLTSFPVIDVRQESQSFPSGGERDLTTPESSTRSLLSGNVEDCSRARRGSAQVSPGMVSLHASTSSLLRVSPQNNHHSGPRSSRGDAFLLDTDASTSSHHFHVVRGAATTVVPTLEVQQLHQQNQDEASTIAHALQDHVFSSQRAARSSVLVIEPTTLVGAHRKSTIRMYEEDDINDSCVV